MLAPTSMAGDARTRAAATRQRPDRTTAVAPEDWSICLKDAHPAYLDWDEFMANRRQLADNVGRYDAGRPGDSAQRQRIAAGDCQLRSVRPSDGPAILGTARGLSGLCLRRR